MRKEVYIAIAVGVLFGLLVAFGLWRANWALTNKKAVSISASPTQQAPPSISPPVNKPFKLITPRALFVSNLNRISFSGIAPRSSIIVISGETKDWILAPSQEETFENVVDLERGVNQILVSLFDKGAIETREQVIVVSNENFLEDKKEDSTLGGYSKASIGAITDITDNTIQIRNFEGEIKLVATSEETTYTQETSPQKNIKLEDVAIGDYIVALGYEDAKSVLNASDVSIINPLKAPSRKVLFGKITSIKGKIVTLEVDGENEWTLNFPAKWDGPEISELSSGQMVVVIGEPNSGNSQAIVTRTVSFLPDPANTPTPIAPSPESQISPTKKPSPTSVN